MSVTELETRIVKMQEWEQLAQDAAAEADTIKAEMLARDTEELTAGRFIVRWRSVLTSRFNSSEFKKAMPDVYAAFTRQSQRRRFSVSA